MGEAAPILPLLCEIRASDTLLKDYESFAFRESLTVLTLFGRRLALLDLTPTSVLAVARAVLGATTTEPEGWEAGFADRATAAVMEGFVLGREERTAADHDARAIADAKPIRVDDQTFALILSGVHDPGVLGELVDRLGRAMLDADVETAIVDMTQLGEANGERAAALFRADEVVRMLGGACFFAGVGPRWQSAMTDAGIEIHQSQISENFAEALDASRALIPDRATSLRAAWRSLLRRGRVPFLKG